MRVLEKGDMIRIKHGIVRIWKRVGLMVDWYMIVFDYLRCDSSLFKTCCVVNFLLGKYGVIVS